MKVYNIEIEGDPKCFKVEKHRMSTEQESE